MIETHDEINGIGTPADFGFWLDQLESRWYEKYGHGRDPINVVWQWYMTPGRDRNHAHFKNVSGPPPYSNPVFVMLKGLEANHFGVIAAVALPEGMKLQVMAETEAWPAIEPIWLWIRGALAKDGWISPKETHSLDPALGRKDNEVRKSKTGPRNYKLEDKIAAVVEWDNLDRDLHPEKLQDYLEHKFGIGSGGIPNVARSTFHSWRKLVPKEP